MNLSWLQSAMMGFVCGMTEPLPLSASAHRGVLMRFFGVEELSVLYALVCHVAVLAVVMATGQLELGRLRRAGKLLRTPSRRRSAQPDRNSAGTLALLRPALILTVIGRLLAPVLSVAADRLYLLSGALLVCGIILWLPTQMRGANKDGRHLTPADGTLMGLGAALSAVPGVSLVGTAASVGLLRGADRRYALRIAWILLAAGLGADLVLDCLAVAGNVPELSLPVLLSVGICGVCAAFGAFAAVRLMQFLVSRVRGCVTGFCYYNWGMALLCLVLFLLV